MDWEMQIVCKHPCNFFFGVSAMKYECGFLKFGAGLFAALSLISFNALALGVPADVSFTYIPFTVSTTAIPTLAEWALVVMSIAIGLLSIRLLRNGSSSKVIGGLFVVGSLLVGGFTGNDLIFKASATPSQPDIFNNPAGATFEFLTSLNPADSWNSLTVCGSTATFTTGAIPNTSGVPIKLTSVVNNNAISFPTDNNSADYSSTQQCVQNLILNPGQSCQVIVTTICAG